MRPELRAAFFHDDEGFVARLRTAVSSSPEELFRAVHTLKSVALMLGLETLGAQLSEAEDFLVQKDTARAQIVIQKFLKSFEKEKAGFLAETSQAEKAAQEAATAEVVEVLFRPRTLVSPKGCSYVYHRRELIRLEGPEQADWVVLIDADEGLKAIAVSEISGYISTEQELKAA